MIIKKFQAETESEAMEHAKAELGKDAIVMNIKTVRPKGIYKLFRKAKVEVTAAVDDNTNYAQTSAAGGRNDSRAAGNQSLHEGIQKSEPIRDSGESAIEKKLNDLQILLEKQMAVTKDSELAKGSVSSKITATVSEAESRQEEEPEKKAETVSDVKNMASSKRVACIQLIYNQLLRNEIDEQYANQIVTEIDGSLKKDASVDHILGAFYQKIILKLGHPAVLQLEENKTKYVFFIGPTGVGKTTTIAKLASSFKLIKKAKVALLTADTYRIAAVEQLRTYANILNIPLKVVYSAEELSECRKEMEGYDLVMIDTAGRSHKSKEQRDDIKRLIEAIPPEDREIYLVLSATTKYRDLVKIAEVYREMAEFRLIFTKLDETGSVGNLFNIRMLTGAPLSYNTWGQNVPDDIGEIDAQQIAKQLLGGGE